VISHLYIIYDNLFLVFLSHNEIIMIIGLVGRMASGKGEFVEILKKFGFKHITLSAMVRQEARRLGLEETRENLMEIGNSMRNGEGAGVLAVKALEVLKEDLESDWIIDGIRNPAEINALRNFGRVCIAGLYASEEILINRILSRKRNGDDMTEEKIKEKLYREWGIGEPEDGQQLEKCMQEVDAVVRNEGDMDDLYNNVMQLYKLLLAEQK
jgi:dephospho-CoA kinase